MRLFKRVLEMTELTESTWRGSLIAAACALALAAPALAGGTADEGMAVTEQAGSPLLYVIKVTPALAYLDAGEEGGASLDQDYLILRENGRQGHYVLVGSARIIRLYEGFSIAEITGVEEGEEVAVLHRAIARETWDRLASEAASEGREVMLGDDETAAPRGAAAGTRSIHFLAGGELGKAIDLTAAGGQITGAEDITDAAIALRMAKTFARRWRLNLTYRAAGEPLQMDGAEVTQLGVELDVHLLLRGPGAAGPYVGLGAGMQQLSWDAPTAAGALPGANLDETAYKLGLNLMGGFEIPSGDGWVLTVEGGYQAVKDWNEIIDGSNVRLFVGVGRYF